MHLLFSANRWLLAQKIRQSLLSGVTVLADRYCFSGITYSLAKKLEKTWVCMPEVGLPKPDIVLFLDIDSTQVSTRKNFGKEILEKRYFQKNVYKNMLEMCSAVYWQVRHFRTTRRALVCLILGNRRWRNDRKSSRKYCRKGDQDATTGHRRQEIRNPRPFRLRLLTFIYMSKYLLTTNMYTAVHIANTLFFTDSACRDRTCARDDRSG